MRVGYEDGGSQTLSKGSKRKRATRPWQDPQALRGISDLLATGSLGAAVDQELELEGYEVRRVDADGANKEYICPACGNAVAEGEGHVVVWPSGDSDLRRHWHRYCWRIEVRRSTGAR